MLILGTSWQMHGGLMTYRPYAPPPICRAVGPGAILPVGMYDRFALAVEDHGGALEALQGVISPQLDVTQGRPLKGKHSRENGEKYLDASGGKVLHPFASILL